jgi:predicted DNA-binding transcriptional regulator AlpA
MTLVTASEAARLLRLSVRTLERYRISGLGPKYVRATDRSIRYRVSDLEAWIASRIVASTSEH